MRNILRRIEHLFTHTWSYDGTPPPYEPKDDVFIETRRCALCGRTEQLRVLKGFWEVL